MKSLMFSHQAGRIFLMILATVATGAALYFAKPVLAPIVFGVVVGVVVSPVADNLARVGIARVLVSVATLFFALILLVGFFLVIEPLISDIITRLPQIRYEIRDWISAASGLLQGLESISEEIERTVGADGKDTDTAASIPGVLDALWLAPNFGAQVLIFAGTLFFFVLTRDDLYRTTGDFCQTLFEADRAVSRYFALVTIVNSGLGVALFAVLALLGVKNAALWGVTAALLNFVLYLGPLIVVCALLVAGLMQFGGFYALLPPALFLCLNLTEAQFVTPAFVGQQLRMSPLVVFLAIVFGLWLWGPVGAIVALPVLLWLGVVLRGSARLMTRQT